MFRITKSKLREELSALYFTNPNKKYYLRELEKLLNFSLGNIRRELIKLENTGLFLIENKGNLVYYYLNQSYPLFEELKSIIFKTSGAPKIIQNLEKFIGISQAIIYGSFAKGEEKGDSDIDLLIIGEVNEDKLIEVISKLERKLHREINYAIYGKEDFKKKDEGNPFILDILKEKKIFLVGDEKKML